MSQNKMWKTPEQVVVKEKNKMADAKAKIEILATKIKDLASA